LDKEKKNMLIVNYWDSTIGVFGLNPHTAQVDNMRSMYDPKMGKPMKARAEKHVNHSDNDAKTQKERRADPHSHAVILDPFYGKIAYVPDLGMDVIRQFLFNPEKGDLSAAGTVSSGPAGRQALGPRYIEFHPTYPVAYVINELSSEVSVFFFDRVAAERLVTGKVEPAQAAPTLRLVQTISTIPEAFPGSKNTCGRIAVHAQGQFVCVSNRGHDSITVFRVHDSETAMQGQLSVASIAHTRGATPRHFQFDTSGQWLIVANQDSDSIDIFNFNLATGKLVSTGQKFSLPSPNFVCAMKPTMEHMPPARDDTHSSVTGRSELIFVHQSSL
jgi:6-phosphogluconolactonase (cycloisomerase 2 family)